jgi:hypothetical protein
MSMAAATRSASKVKLNQFLRRRCRRPGLARSLIDCVVTICRFRQRDYQGLPADRPGRSPQKYVERLVDVFRGSRQVMKPTGTLGW